MTLSRPHRYLKTRPLGACFVASLVLALCQHGKNDKGLGFPKPLKMLARPAG